jgi:hypothetical protein
VRSPVADVVPVAGLAAWWVSAWLAGRVPTDDVLDHVALDVELLAQIRGSGATTVGLALPVSGDLLGLGGPPDFNAAALAAGQAAVTDTGLGLVPSEHEGLVWWTEHAAARRQLPDVGEADRALRADLLTCADRLAALEVARWRPEVADLVLELGRPTSVEAPPGTPARCVGLAVRGARCTRIVELALGDDGGAVSASEIEARRDALWPLERAARRALVAACSPEVWPPD